MKNRIYDEINGLWYERHGDYYFPLLDIPANQLSNGENLQHRIGRTAHL